MFYKVKYQTTTTNNIVAHLEHKVLLSVSAYEYPHWRREKMVHEM